MGIILIFDVLFLCLKEKERTVNASVDRQKKQTNLRFDRLCGFDGSTHAQSTQALTVRLCLRKAVTYENLNVREGGLRRNS
jgi:hypothetical protein